MSRKDVEISKAFRMFAKNNNSTIPSSEIETAVRVLGFPINTSLKLPEGDIDFYGFKKLIGSMDENENIFTRDVVEGAFKRLEMMGRNNMQCDEVTNNTQRAEATDGSECSGYISATNLAAILSTGSNALSQEDISDFLMNFPANEQGQICYELLLKEIFDE